MGVSQPRGDKARGGLADQLVPLGRRMHRVRAAPRVQPAAPAAARRRRRRGRRAVESGGGDTGADPTLSMASASADPSAASADAGPEVHVHVGTPPGKPPEDTELVARLESAIQSGGAQMLMQNDSTPRKDELTKAIFMIFRRFFLPVFLVFTGLSLEHVRAKKKTKRKNILRQKSRQKSSTTLCEMLSSEVARRFWTLQIS